MVAHDLLDQPQVSGREPVATVVYGYVFAPGTAQADRKIAVVRQPNRGVGELMGVLGFDTYSATRVSDEISCEAGHAQYDRPLHGRGFEYL